jgi:alpha-ketoglutarate-dependent taurine dioxygenase
MTVDLHEYLSFLPAGDASTSVAGTGGLPLLIEPRSRGAATLEWLADHREAIDKVVLSAGAVVFRDFGVATAEDFGRFVEAISGPVMTYRERSSPRHEVRDRIYTSTDHPPHQRIFPHNEHSYAQTIPLRLYFHGLRPADRGGATPVADTRRILARLSDRTKQRFRDKGWMYVRNFNDGFGLSWQTSFQTDDRAAVEEYCTREHIGFRWKDGGRLRTWQVRPATIRHPRSGEEAWFNHAAFFHISSMEPDVEEALRLSFREEDLPNNTYYGDGTPIEGATVHELRRAYLAELSAWEWKRGDVLLVDNILASHARDSFEGERKILVAMAEPHTRDDI